MSRRPGYSGPLALELTQIEAWSRLREHRLAQWEVTALMAMDAEYLAAIGEKKEEVVVDIPMNGPLFDAFFS